MLYLLLLSYMNTWAKAPFPIMPILLNSSGLNTNWVAETSMAASFILLSPTKSEQEKYQIE